MFVLTNQVYNSQRLMFQCFLLASRQSALELLHVHLELYANDSILQFTPISCSSLSNYQIAIILLHSRYNTLFNGTIMIIALATFPFPDHILIVSYNS